MNYTYEIKNRMNEILRTDTDTLARKYMGSAADRMSTKQKDKIIGELYMSFDKALKAKPKSDLDIRKEEIDAEMRKIRNGDRDELLGARIKNYNPSISTDTKDEVLVKIYEDLQTEMDKLDTQPSQTAPIKTARGMTEQDIDANISEILHGDTDSYLERNADLYGFSYDVNMSAEEKEDILSCIYDILEEDRKKLKSAPTETKPVVVSQKEKAITEIEHDMNEIKYGDTDYVIETYAPKYQVDYDEGMNQQYKEQIVDEIYRSAETEYKKAYGQEENVTFEAQSEKLQKMGQNAEYKHKDDIAVTINTYFDDYDSGVYDRYLEDVYNYNEVRKGLDYLDEEIAYVDFLYNEIEPVVNRAGSGEEVNELRDRLIERYELLEKVREKYVKKGNRLAAHYGTEFSAENKAKTVNNRNIDAWKYNPNLSDMGEHYENVNAGARLVMDGVLDEERAANLTYSKARELDDLNDVAETIFFSGFGGNAATEWFMTDDEREYYNTINYEQGGKAADEYYASIEQTLNDRKTQWMTDAAEKLAQESRWQTTTGTVLAAPLRAITSMYGNYRDKKNGNVSANSGDKQSQIFTDFARQKVAESLPKGWDTVYNIGTGFGDTVAIDLFSAMLCPESPVLASLVSTMLGASSEMQQTVMEEFESGASEKEALKAGLEAGLMDAIISQVELTKILKNLDIPIGTDEINSETVKFIANYIVDYGNQQNIKNWSK